MGRGARPVALGSLLALALLAGLARELSWPAAGPDGPFSGLDEGAGLRLFAPGEVAEGLRRLPAGCAPPQAPGPGEALLAGSCPARVRPLPLSARRVLGLASDPNQLTAAEFEEVHGIGPALSRRIILTRARLGGFGSIEDLERVPGIGPAKMTALRAALRPVEP